MSTAAPHPVSGTAQSPATPSLGGQTKIFRFLPIDTYPHLIDFAQRPIGKALLLASFALALLPFFSPLRSLLITLAAGACAYAGRYRASVRTTLTLLMALAFPNWFEMYWSVAPPQGFIGRLEVARDLWPALMGVFLLAFFAMYLVRLFRDNSLARHPIVCLHVFVLSLLLVCSSLSGGAFQNQFWIFVQVFCAYFWFLCFALADQRAKDGDPPLIQLGVLHPFWGSSPTPYGKGAAYLRQVEARNPRDLAITQLKGLKLLLWVNVIKLLNDLLVDYFGRHILNIPFREDTVTQYVAGHPYTRYICWASLVVAFFSDMLGLTLFGGPIVAVARLAGYRLLRNTYRPLTSATLAEFWNRYYFYFKELLVQIFFFPTFLRCFKSHRRIRILFATFMAATVGNFIYHFLRDIHIAAQFGLIYQLIGFQTYAFYCLVLGIGIGLSQARIDRIKPIKFLPARRLVAITTVLGFYCVISIFSDTYSPHTLVEHLSFLCYLFGLNS